MNDLTDKSDLQKYAEYVESSPTVCSTREQPAQ